MNTEPVNCTDSELSTYLRALAAGFLPTFYSDTSPSALSSSMAIASKSWRSGKRTGHFPGFPSLPMSESSTASPGADSSMSSPEDSRARTSASQAKAQESTASDPAYGVKWRGSLARFDPDLRSWKTAQHSLIEGSDECSVIWPRSGMTVDGQCYLLPTLGRRTGANESGLWQTPVADDSVNRAAGKFNSRGEPKLSAQVLWPTPTVNGNYNKVGLSAKSGDGLATAVTKFPSPSTLGINGGSHSRAAAVKRGQDKAEVNGGSLNPTWVEWLMGWPLGWTDLKPSAMGKCRSALLRHGDC